MPENIKEGITVGWWSAGITSAVACKIALEMYSDVRLYYIHIETHHKDNERFKRECEDWYGCKIITLQSKDFKDQFEVITHTGMVNHPNRGTPCTPLLKKQVRYELEKQHELNLFNETYIKNQIWGFEYERRQINRAIRFGQQYPHTNPLFPLIEKGITKNMCAGMIQSAGIELPIMYRMGYNNNNCIGCPKGGMGYWNKIRVDFPHIFNKMAITERQAGFSCINGVFLDQLHPSAGRHTQEVIPECGIICDIDFGDIPDKSLEDIMTGQISIYDAIKTTV